MGVGVRGHDFALLAVDRDARVRGSDVPVAGVTAQWYFAPPGTRTFAGTTIGSIKNALGPSFGSLALGALVLTAVRVAREVNETRAKRPGKRRRRPANPRVPRHHVHGLRSRAHTARHQVRDDPVRRHGRRVLRRRRRGEPDADGEFRTCTQCGGILGTLLGRRVRVLRGVRNVRGFGRVRRVERRGRARRRRRRVCHSRFRLVYVSR